MSYFPSFRKIPRLSNAYFTATEKIDGTNGLILIEDGEVRAGSKNRWLTPFLDDNFGFAGWVYQNAGTLYDRLGPGFHYGEWFGKGIQRGYGLTERRFALFNLRRHGEALSVEPDEIGLCLVPVLCEGPVQREVEARARALLSFGSFLIPGFLRPEGYVLHEKVSGATWKRLLENDEIRKGAA